MTATEKPLVTSNIRVPRDVWRELRRYAFDKEKSINQIVVEAIIAKLEKD